MASASIELQAVGISFEEGPLLQNLNLRIKKGERYVLIGPSGHGKSVILKMMAGILAPSTGRVLVEGEDLHTLKGDARHRLMRKMGMLFQKNALFDSLSVAENIAFPLREISSLSELDIQKKVSTFLEAVQIPHAKDLFPDEISGGMQKRLGIARALALNPEIIFYDDPTAGLDPITSRVIIDLILGLQKKNNSTLVAITNDMNRAFQLADRIGLVFKGELIEAGTVAQTKASSDPRIQQFIAGHLSGPITESLA